MMVLAILGEFRCRVSLDLCPTLNIQRATLLLVGAEESKNNLECSWYTS